MLLDALRSEMQFRTGGAVSVIAPDKRTTTQSYPSRVIHGKTYWLHDNGTWEKTKPTRPILDSQGDGPDHKLAAQLVCVLESLAYNNKPENVRFAFEFNTRDTKDQESRRMLLGVEPFTLEALVSKAENLGFKIQVSQVYLRLKEIGNSASDICPHFYNLKKSNS